MMQTVTGIFASREAAERAAVALTGIGIPADRINLLTPDSSSRDLARVPTADAEQPGTGTALGTVVGGAVGAAGGMPLGAAVASGFLPGVGPIVAFGLLGAALLGGAGAAVGATLEHSGTEGLPRDELFVYEDALRRGCSVVIGLVDGEEQAEPARGLLAGAGTESVDAARETWWVGLRDAEAIQSRVQGEPFAGDEATFRRGFEAALHRGLRGRTYEDAFTELRAGYPDLYATPAFRRGFDRGRAYERRWRPPGRAA